METTITTERLEAMLAEVRAFMEAEVYPVEAAAHGKPWEEIVSLLDAKRALVRERGLWTPQIGEDWGGPGLSLAAFGQVSEVLGRSPFGHYIFNCQAPDAGNMEILIEHGTPEQQERFLWPLLRGEIRSCFSMTEPEHAGSNPTVMSTTAV